jgi:predicted oxidoreductase
LLASVAAYELIERGRKVLLIEKDIESRFGGTREGVVRGVHMIGTPHHASASASRTTPTSRTRTGSAARSSAPGDHWPRQWAKLYCDRSKDLIFDFLDAKGVEFLPIVNWPERGLHEVLNSVPRWHVTWGTGYELATRVIAALERHPKRARTSR